MIEIDRHTDGQVSAMTPAVTDDQIQELAATAKPFSLVQLRWAADRHQDGAEAIELEHQRRMVSLRAEGVIAILCPVISDVVAGVADHDPDAGAGRGDDGSRPVRRGGNDDLRGLLLRRLPGRRDSGLRAHAGLEHVEDRGVAPSQ